MIKKLAGAAVFPLWLASVGEVDLHIKCLCNSRLSSFTPSWLYIESSHIMSVIRAQCESDLLYSVCFWKRPHCAHRWACSWTLCIIEDYFSVPSVVRLSIVTGLCISTAACHISLLGFPSALIDVMTNSDICRWDCQNVNWTNRFILFYRNNIWQTLRAYFPTNTMKLLPLEVLVGTRRLCTLISPWSKFSEWIFVQFCMHSLLS